MQENGWINIDYDKPINWLYETYCLYIYVDCLVFMLLLRQCFKEYNNR